MQVTITLQFTTICADKDDQIPMNNVRQFSLCI